MSKIDTVKWEEFSIDRLFTKLDLKMKKDIFNKATDVSLEKTEEYSLPLVNAKHYNNGIMYYGKPEDYESASMTIDIVADGAASTGDVYAQPQETGVLYNAYLIKLKELKQSARSNKKETTQVHNNCLADMNRAVVLFSN